MDEEKNPRFQKGYLSLSYFSLSLYLYTALVKPVEKVGHHSAVLSPLAVDQVQHRFSLLI